MRVIFYCFVFLFGLSVCPASLAYRDINTPEEALQSLLEANKRFVEDKSISPDRSQDRRAASAAKQKPFAIVLGCSDSRVSPELAFDQGVGDIFVVRVAGNVVGSIELDSIEYSAVYNQSSIIVVLGHEKCGAVKAVLAGKAGDIKAIAALIKPTINPEDSLDANIEANIRNSVCQIKKFLPIKKLITAGKINVVGAYYELTSGKVRLLKS